MDTEQKAIRLLFGVLLYFKKVGTALANWEKWLKENFLFDDEDKFEELSDAMKKRETFMRKPYWTMYWAVNERRRDKRTGAISPVKASKYYAELSKEGAGWNESRTSKNG